MMKLQEILNQFDVPQQRYQFNTISNGLINDTYLVLDEAPKFILQKLNIEVFTNYQSLLDNIILALPLLDSTAYQKLKLIPTKSQEHYLNLEGKEVWRMMSYIPNSTVYNTTNDTHIAKETGRIIGEFHQLLQPLEVNNLGVTIPDFHNLEFRIGQFKTALEHAEMERLITAKEDIAFVQTQIERFSKIDFGLLPLRACHNDTKLNNILFNQSGKALCLIDLDTIMPGKSLYDFGDALRTLLNPALEDESDLNKIECRLDLFESFLEGLKPYAQFYTSKEKELLPLAPVIMPFLHGIRALTDYLEKNKYYKVSYPLQNLDRSRSLFNFAQKALALQEDMQRLVELKLY